MVSYPLYTRVRSLICAFFSLTDYVAFLTNAILPLLVRVSDRSPDACYVVRGSLASVRNPGHFQMWIIYLSLFQLETFYVAEIPYFLCRPRGISSCLSRNKDTGQEKKAI
ncbi:uncharacterized protein EV420DRAFT_403213 [Desarmillaria tabescens]|uniref:Uncharacterized protein n=1 Tax=Armillaria tabescens TaxID=1929756 RepID=A0AA39KDU9_ARMTA|nr:uncharacterized protein EV420DRAFT_403213 [Desarmillaria tabescens]KAK0457959.1 hypothetical protein EV420DRAFT_403213 [Desarmillaria tabescens]